MADSKDAEPRAEHELKDVSAGEVPDAVAGSDPGADDQVQDQPAPGRTLEIETLEGAAAGTLTRTIRVKIEDADLVEPVEPVD